MVHPPCLPRALAGAAAVLAVCAAPLGAQVVRVHSRVDSLAPLISRSDHRQLMIRLDSLRREIEDRPVNAPERARLAHELMAVVLSLDELSRAGSEMGMHMGEAMGMRVGPAITRDGGEGFPPRRYEDAMPRGWIGINVEAPKMIQLLGDTEYVRYFEFPVILSVEPNSPAERAGIAQGDVLTTFNGESVRERAINMTRLLEPQRRIAVTVQRNGQNKRFGLVVDKVPSNFRDRLVELNTQPPLSDLPFSPVTSGRVLIAKAPPSPDTDPETGDPGAWNASGRVMYRVFDGSSSVAGARLQEIQNGDLARALNVRAGVLVVDVAPGPARISGLKGGDVIVKVAGQPVASIRELRARIAERTPDDSVELEIRRGQRTKRLKLRW